MFQVWEGDLFLFSVDFEEEAELYSEQGYTIVKEA
jgi:hypothetical protein